MPRYNPTAQVRWYLVPTVTVAVPTVAQITAGTRLDTMMRSYAGFAFEPGDTDVSDLANRRDKSVPGTSPIVAASIQLYSGNLLADTEETTRAAFVEAASSNIVRVYFGAPVATNPADVFPCIIKGINTDTVGRGDAMTYTVGLSINATPGLYVAIA